MPSTLITAAGARVTEILRQIKVRVAADLNCPVLSYVEVFPTSTRSPAREHWLAHACKRSAHYQVDLPDRGANASGFAPEFRGERGTYRYLGEFMTVARSELSADGTAFVSGALETGTTPVLRITTNCPPFSGSGLMPVGYRSDIVVMAAFDWPDPNAVLGGLSPAYPKTDRKTIRSEPGISGLLRNPSPQRFLRWELKNITCPDLGESATLELPPFLLDGKTITLPVIRLRYSEQLIREWRTLTTSQLR